MQHDVLLLRALRQFINALGHEAVPIASLNELRVPEAHGAPAGQVLLLEGMPTDGRTMQELRELHRLSSDLVVVVVTDAVPPVEQVVGCGVHGYLRKPVQLAELELMLIRLAERKGSVRAPIPDGSPISGSEP